MVKYWVIAPYRSTKTKIFEKVWQYDKDNDTIAVGWKALGNISNIENIETLRKKYIETYPEVTNNSTITRDCNALWNFYHKISPGDIIIARQGRKKILAIGTVKQPKKVYGDIDKAKERVGNLTSHYYPNFIDVNWEEKNIEFEKQIFSFYTMYEINEDKYDSIIKGKTPDENEEELEQKTDEQKTELYLEKYLEEIIVENFDTVLKRRLKLYIDEEGNNGQQYPIVGDNGKEIGRIDILAQDPSTNSYVVIELKKGRSSGKVVGQILEYMGWVKDNLCEHNEKVRGIIILKDKDERLNNALKMVKDLVDIKYYSLNLSLKD